MLTVQCSGCGICCGDHIATLTHHDLRRLVKFTGIAANRIVQFFSPAEFDGVDNDDPDWIKLSYGRRQMGLRKKNEHCLFLSKKKQCKVYEVRPMLCHLYPLELTLTEDNELHDIEIRDIIRDKSVKCNHVYGKLKSKRELQRMAVRDDAESESFWRKLEKWNRRPEKGRKNDFLTFLGFKIKT